MMTEQQIADAKAAIPVLKQIREQCGDNYWLQDIAKRCSSWLEDFDRCQMFDIWSTDRNLEYGCGTYKMDYISNVGHIDKQWLLEISFPTGAFIFGERYDTEYFNKFFDELLDGEVKPDYVDRLNKALYYKPDKARKAWDHYKAVYKKYMNGNKERMKEWKKAKLRKELEELEK